MLSQDEISKIQYASNIVGGAVHPDTKEIIAAPMRLSGFVPMNVPIILILMFTKNQTPVFNAGMQWVNQTYNAGMNYGNRNASSAYTNSDLLRGYFGAVTASLTISYTTRTLLSSQLATLAGPRLALANAALNYTAASISNVANCSLMRWKETQEGIYVSNKEQDK